MTRLQDLYEIGGQSPWLDNLRRDWIKGGQLAELLALGVRGITSNPTIFAKAMSGHDVYDDQFKSLVKDHSVRGRVLGDGASPTSSTPSTMLRPLYDESDREDGFVSLEVSPALAHDTDGTVRDARMLHERIDEPNLFVKVPATREGIPAIETLIGDGHSINVTLIFGLDRYDEVMEAYLRGLEALVAAGREAELAQVASVASFFVSRVDTEVDRRLESLAGGERRRPRRSRPAAPRRRRPGAGGLPALPSHLRRGPLGSPPGEGSPGPAPAVGLDLHQEPRLPRPPLRRQPHRSRPP